MKDLQPPDVVYPTKQPPWDPSGEVHVSFASTDDPWYQKMLEVIREARRAALAKPRVDMPRAEIIPGECRMLVPPPVPAEAPPLRSKLLPDRTVELSWQRTAEVIGLRCEVHRGDSPDFVPTDNTRLVETTLGHYRDQLATPGKRYYALRVTDGERYSRPARAELLVP
jgi:hypothetical protein